MTYRGHIKNGQITLDEPVALPEGTAVYVEMVEHRDSELAGENLSDVLLRHAGKGRDLPSDLAAQHDHYAHGKPKQ